MSDMFARLLIKSHFLVVLGILCLLLSIPLHACAKYAEGKGNLINSGNKLVFQQLRPAEFIRLYEEKRDCLDNVISKPDFDVLRLLVAAYDALGDADHQLEILDQMLAVASEKKQNLVKLLQSAVLFSIGKVEEGELLYSEVLNGKMDWMTKATVDIVMKSDRAMARGDFTTAEAYNKQLLTQTFPKKTPLVILAAHFNLAKIYYMTERLDEAKIHFHFCAESGGETCMKSAAANVLKNL